MENLLFYNLTKDFVKMCDQDEFATFEARNLEAASIYADFVDPHGDFQVSLPLFAS